MVMAQLVHVLYNVVDRMFIGRIPDASVNALTGVGLTFPILLIINAFANLFGTGGVPLFSMARGAASSGKDEKQTERASLVMNNVFFMLCAVGVVLTVVALLLKKPFLYLFGASDVTYPYANDYITIYLFGTVFVMISLGMNGFINAQGFANKGMMTVLIGAVLNLILDPLFIFVFNMGVQGAALATVISQFVSALWVVLFLTGQKTLFRLDFKRMRPNWKLVREIVSLGIAGFIMGFTTSAVQMVCNAMLSQFGGDLYVGVMTVINSIREMASLPVTGITHGAQPVLGYNYGAKEFHRLKVGIRFMALLGGSYTLFAWIC
ncbi:MAG: MATE family efflux transporter, partial [Butyricicoccus sp.]|nr:MATE family efflux transporter [Butyricicoccus sp.]